MLSPSLDHTHLRLEAAAKAAGAAGAARAAGGLHVLILCMAHGIVHLRQDAWRVACSSKSGEGLG